MVLKGHFLILMKSGVTLKAWFCCVRLHKPWISLQQNVLFETCIYCNSWPIRSYCVNPLQVQIGNAYYENCSCVRYVDLWLTVSLSAGFGFLFIIIVIVVIIVLIRCCRRCRKARSEPNVSNDNCPASMELNQDVSYYSTIPAAAQADKTATQYCRPGPLEPRENKQYSELGPAQSTTNNNSPYYLSLINDDYMLY